MPTNGCQGGNLKWIRKGFALLLVHIVAMMEYVEEAEEGQQSEGQQSDGQLCWLDVWVFLGGLSSSLSSESPSDGYKGDEKNTNLSYYNTE
ncbi:hypothetical protein EYF80_067223 [Liparis tanakae]|uniref:Uncharacterized protein n=1 Tax=Liparis tanakae TaxID=230148 RepID=A0A4Z2E2P4_9TELE|nr:hypothetical protein EYF80_067223 [Liparis tanakae]